MRELAEQNRILHERAHEAIFLVDAVAAGYVDVNPAAERLTGPGVAGLRTLRAEDLIPDLGRVFHPFFTARGAGEGAGPGLSVCYGIVTGHRGLIRARNNDMGASPSFLRCPRPLTGGGGPAF